MRQYFIIIIILIAMRGSVASCHQSPNEKTFVGLCVFGVKATSRRDSQGQPQIWRADLWQTPLCSSELDGGADSFKISIEPGRVTSH